MPVSSRHRRRSRWWVWTLVTVGAIVLVLGLVVLYYVPKTQQAIAAAKNISHAAKQLQSDLGQQKFDAAKTDVVTMEAELATAKTAVEKMQGLRAWPYVGTQYKTIEKLLVVGDDATQAAGTLVNFLANVFAPFSGQKVSLASITPAQKGTLLQNMADHGEELRTAQEKILHAQTVLNTIPTHGLIGPLAQAIDPVRQEFPTLTDALNQAIPATKIIPTILGYPDPKTYLFLLENNTELRPGGGFIGTYGLMKVSSGDITSLVTDNVYNLDNAANKLATIQPPEAMKKMLKTSTWYFRDSNWSPDFPTSAQQAVNLYEREGGKKNVDGVVAITPTAIAHMISLVGSIKVAGIEFTGDNFVDQLQYQVEQGFLKAGIPELQRKDIISTLTSELMHRIMTMPISEWSKLFVQVNSDLEGKQILIYLRDTTAENLLIQQNWGGAIASTTTEDSIMVADANLASLKTDEVMQREYTYTVTPDSDGAVAELKIHYRNTGKFDWKTTRYNTYVRVYVPSGSVLLSSSGAQLREKSQAPGEVTTSTELGKTVFAGFKSIEPGTESDLILKYRLPTAVAQQWANGSYTLLWQKEPGMLPPTIHMNIQGTSKITSIDGVDNEGKISKTSAQFDGLLNRDRTIIIHQ